MHDDDRHDGHDRHNEDDRRDAADTVAGVEEEQVIETIARELRAPIRFDATLDMRVMGQVRAGRPRGAAAAWGWLLRPRTLRVSPLGGLALAAGVAAVALVGGRLAGREREGPVVVVAAPDAPGAAAAGLPVAAAAYEPRGPRTVQFVLVAPAAISVAVVGDFNDWDPAGTPLQRTRANGVWAITLPLAPGRYQYTFVIDGTRWMPDPQAPRALENDFGRPNSVLTVAE
ncbi:MAG: isoamylase early set domain-containing protein [Gemmatimonadaceae bacterium]